MYPQISDYWLVQPLNSLKTLYFESNVHLQPADLLSICLNSGLVNSVPIFRRRLPARTSRTLVVGYTMLEDLIQRDPEVRVEWIPTYGAGKWPYGKC